jgi:hypothetical protein
LLHARISPRQPPRNGSPSSQQTLRQRLRTHYAGNAEGSTLRKTVGYLLAGELDIQLRRVGSGTRKTFVEGKRAATSPSGSTTRPRTSQPPAGRQPSHSASQDNTSTRSGYTTCGLESTIRRPADS